jgi:hypothetical protein
MYTTKKEVVINPVFNAPNGFAAKLVLRSVNNNKHEVIISTIGPDGTESIIGLFYNEDVSNGSKEVKIL